MAILAGGIAGLGATARVGFQGARAGYEVAKRGTFKGLGKMDLAHGNLREGTFDPTRKGKVAGGALAYGAYEGVKRHNKKRNREQ